MKICPECKDVIMYCKCAEESFENEQKKALKELFNEYLKYFGNKTPYPPPDIMKNMIKLKKDGTLDKIQNDPKAQAIINKHLTKLRNKLKKLKNNE